MNRKKVWVLVICVGLTAFAGLVLTGAIVSAQQEQPLAQIALQESELSKSDSNMMILSVGPTVFDDVAQPINAMNSAAFRVHEFIEAYLIHGLGDQVQVGHYVYRYRDTLQAQEQAQALVAYAQQGKAVPFQPVLIDDGSGAKGSVRGPSLRFTSPETGGVYYWFFGVKGRILTLLFVGGPPDEATRAAFEFLKARVQQR